MKDLARNVLKFPCGRCRNHYSHERIIDTIADHPSELACDVINFLIREARAHRERSVPTRLHCLVSNAITLNDLLCRLADLPTETVSELDQVTDGNGDLLICRSEPEEVAVRSAQNETFSSRPNFRDNRDNRGSQVQILSKTRKRR